MKWDFIINQESYPSKFYFDGEEYELMLDTLFYRYFKSSSGKFAAAATVQDKSLIINESWIKENWKSMDKKAKAQFNAIVKSHLKEDAEWINELILLIEDRNNIT